MSDICRFCQLHDYFLFNGTPIKDYIGLILHRLEHLRICLQDLNRVDREGGEQDLPVGGDEEEPLYYFLYNNVEY